jgi:Acetyltransferase (GNAT) domain
MKSALVAEDRQHELALDSMPRRSYQVEVDSVTESDWSELMGRFDDGNVYQTWSYGAVRWEEKNLSHLLLKGDGEVRAMAQLRIIRPGNLRFGVAYLRWGPICQPHERELDPEVVHAMAAALRDEYVSKRGLYLEILPNAFAGSVRARIFQSAFGQFCRKPGVSAEHYRTFLLDLSPSLEELRKKLDKKWRNQLSAGERNDLHVVEGVGGDDYRRFCALYSDMWKRKKFHTSVSVKEFEQIQERLPETQKLRVLICEQAGKPVAGLVCSVVGESAIYLLGATNEAGMKVKASYVLQWAMVRLLKEKQARFYDLGGIDPAANPGVYHFKRGFTGVDVSNIGSFSACDNSFSAALVMTGRILRDGFRLVRPRFAEATR